ncbi:MAG: hypothetical protein NTW13_05460 [Candidatus Omnitrophica bacterium]|nr:hypothetical protein [Candidatus Omnitrophota bacterium]
MIQDKLKAYKYFIKGVGQTLALSKLYSFDHPVVKVKTKEVFEEIIKFISDNGTLVFSESPDATLLVNGEELKSEDSIMARFIQNFRNLKIGSIDLMPQLTLDEFCVFIDLLNNADSLKEEGSVKEFLKARKVIHILSSFATYKLVNEHEAIIKDGSVIRIEDLSPEAIKNFTLDLNIGEVNKKIKDGDQIYKILAHDPETLSHAVIDYIKDKDQLDELTKILWLIGDYLIDEIKSAKQEEINRRVLNELKDRLLILWDRRGAQDVYGNKCRFADKRFVFPL